MTSPTTSAIAAIDSIECTFLALPLDYQTRILRKLANERDWRDTDPGYALLNAIDAMDEELREQEQAEAHWTSSDGSTSVYQRVAAWSQPASLAAKLGASL